MGVEHLGSLQENPGLSGRVGISYITLSSNNNIVIENEVHFCAHVKMLLFFLQGAERKNKDESKSAEKRIQKWVKQNTSACAGECLSERFFFHANA